VEAVTYRLYGHVFGDRMAYVPPGELDAAWHDEPVGRFRRRLVESGLSTEEGVASIDAECARVVSDTLADVLTLPEPGEDELLTDVVAGDAGE
jgi:2-oxoisovalerate dehydrogenase E1 component